MVFVVRLALAMTEGRSAAHHGLYKLQADLYGIGFVVRGVTRLNVYHYI
jgi:hypothetical protein